MAAQAVPVVKERCYGITNIKSHIPLILDLNDHNYDAWRELFLTHCLAFDVVGHLDGSLVAADDNDLAWKKRDGLVKLWIYGTLAPTLFRSSFKPGGTSRDVWIRIENQFRNNKEARALQLDNELRTTEIGDMTIQDYCAKIKSLADLLENVDAGVNERTLVMCLLNGLNERFDNIINVIKHKDPFPTFETARSMLEMEETRLKKPHRASATHTDTSSSPSALTASAGSAPVTATHGSNQRRFNNNRGKGRNNRSRGGGRHNNSFGNSQWYSHPPYWQMMAPAFPNQYGGWGQYTPGMNYPRQQATANVPHHQALQQAQLMELTPAAQFAQAYSSDTLSSPNAAEWYMDSGASAHMSSSAGPSDTDNSAPM